jgi:hypothetical protein
MLGKLPEEFQVRASSWDAVESMKGSKLYSETEKRLSGFAQTMCKNIIKDNSSPVPIVDNLLAHCVKTTKNMREFSEANQSKPVPKDYKEYPGMGKFWECLGFRVLGKMDHATVVVFKINFD